MSKSRKFTTCAAALAAMLTLIAPESAGADDLDIHTTYATTKGGCASGEKITWTPTAISGPGFNCTLGDSRPAGTGMVAHKGTCQIGGNSVEDWVAFDLGNYRDRFMLSIAGGDWIAMYPCTPVDGLTGTN